MTDMQRRLRIESGLCDEMLPCYHKDCYECADIDMSEDEELNYIESKRLDYYEYFEDFMSQWD